jgi:hypothetical protein
MGRAGAGFRFSASFRKKPASSRSERNARSLFLGARLRDLSKAGGALLTDPSAQQTTGVVAIAVAARSRISVFMVVTGGTSLRLCSSPARENGADDEKLRPGT